MSRKIPQVAKPVTLGGVVWTVTDAGTKDYHHWCIVWRQWEHDGSRYWSETTRDHYLDARILNPRLRAAMGRDLPSIPQPRVRR